jgi:hypothetical protein
VVIALPEPVRGAERLATPTTFVPGKAYARIGCVTAKLRVVPSFEINVAGMKKLTPLVGS